MGIPLWILLLVSRIINSWPTSNGSLPCLTSVTFSKSSQGIASANGQEWIYAGLCHWNGTNSYPAFCEAFWDLGREVISLKRRAECRVVHRVGFTPFHLDIWVPLLSCLFWCFWVGVGFALALKVPGSFANSKYSLTLRASLTDNAWS